MTDRVAQALIDGAALRAEIGHVEPEPEAPVRGKRRLLRSPTGFLAGFAHRCCLEADFAEQYLARARLLGYEILPEWQVEAARQAAETLHRRR